jgi:hypothetical protein
MPVGAFSIPSRTVVSFTRAAFFLLGLVLVFDIGGGKAGYGWEQDGRLLHSRKSQPWEFTFEEHSPVVGFRQPASRLTP